MKKIIKIAIVSCLSLICLICVIFIGAYFYLNLIFFPKNLIPQINSQVNAASKNNIAIKNIRLDVGGKLYIEDATLNSADKKVIAKCEKITIVPSYQMIFNSWKKDKNHIDIPLKIDIKNIFVFQAPVEISGQAKSDFNIGLNLKDASKTSWQGTLELYAFKISRIPFWGDLEDLNGTIKIIQEEISSNDIQGKINGSPARLSFKMSGFISPELSLDAQLSPLSLFMHAKLGKEELTISQLNAAYNKINFKAQGSIKTLSTEPNADIQADLNLDLADLRQLPLEIKSLLDRFSPKGTIQAELNVRGPLKNYSGLSGDLKITAKKILLLNDEINDLSLTAVLQNNNVRIDELNASIFESSLKVTAGIDLAKASLPFTADIALERFMLSKIKEIASIKENLSGRIDLHLKTAGEALNPDNIALKAEVFLRDINVEKLILPQTIKLSLKAAFNNLKDLSIEELTLNDGLNNLSLNGKISNIVSPAIALSGSVLIDLEKLKEYKFFTLPKNLKLSAVVQTKFALNGTAADLNKISLPFEITSEKISANQFTARQLQLKGIFKEMRLDILSLAAKIYAGTLTAKGWINLGNPNSPVFEADTDFSGINVSSFGEETGLISADFGGLLNGRIKISGQGLSPENLDATLSLTSDLQDGKAKGIALAKTFLNTDAAYKNQMLQINRLNLNYDKIELNGEGKISSLLAKPAFDLSFSTILALEDLDKIPYKLPVNLQELKPEGKVAAKINARGEINEWTKIQAAADISCAQMGIKKVMFKNLRIDSKLNDQILSLKAAADSYDGTIQADLKADFVKTEFNYEGNAKITGLNIGSLIKESKIVAQAHEGILNLDLNFSGQGTNPNNLSGTAKLNMKDAKLAGLEIFHAIAGLLQIDFLSNFNIKEANGTFEIKSGFINTEDTKLRGTDADILAKGSLAFNQDINYLVTLLLPLKTAQQINQTALENFFTLQDDQYLTEVEVKGTLTEPKPDASKFVAQRVKQAIKQTIKKEFFKKLEGIFK